MAITATNANTEILNSSSAAVADAQLFTAAEDQVFTRADDERFFASARANVTRAGEEAYQHFRHCTDRCTSINDSGIHDYAKGRSLEELVDKAGIARNVISQSCVSSQDQCDRLSDVKHRLANAIIHKRKYYEDHWFGIITKWVLKLFCRWNNGDTAAIVKAEDFLLRWDSRVPLTKITNPDDPHCGRYTIRTDFTLSGVNISRFYNYTPRRQILLEDGSAVDFSRLAVRV